MEQADRRPLAPQSDLEDRNGPLSPGKAFLLLASLLLVAGAVLYFTKPDPTGAEKHAGLAESEDFALTDEEALARFRELDRLRLLAMHKRDKSLVASILTSDSPLIRLAYRDINRLRHDGIVVDSNFRTIDLHVLNNTAAAIVVEQEVRQNPHFYSARDGKLRNQPRAVLRRIRWTLRREGATWKIYDSDVLSSEFLR